MTKKQIAITLFVGITAFGAGFVLRPAVNPPAADHIQTGSGANQNYQSGNDSSPSQGQILPLETTAIPSEESAEEENTVPADSIRVRVDDGLIQWYDGTVWHTVASVEELAREDKFYQALESFQAFSQELQQEKEGTPPDSWQAGSFLDEETGLSVGIKETPKPTPRPTPTPPAATPTPPPAPSTPDTPSEPDTPSAPDTPSVPSTPSTPDAPSVPDTPSTPDAPSDGDGEDIDGDNIDWGNDYL